MDMSTEEEATPNDVNMTTSERVSTNIQVSHALIYCFFFFAITDVRLMIDVCEWIFLISLLSPFRWLILLIRLL